MAVADSLKETVSGELPKIAGTFKLNTFRFTGGNLIAWRAYVVGKGKLLDVARNPG